MEQGIDWSVPVIVKKKRKGKLYIELPDQAVDKLGIEEGDVVSYTSFVNGGIEVWSIKKSPYTSLEDEGVAERLKKEANS